MKVCKVLRISCLFPKYRYNTPGGEMEERSMVEDLGSVLFWGKEWTVL